MKSYNRREFIKTGALGLTGISLLQSYKSVANNAVSPNALVDKVKLGGSGLTVSRIAMGTGTVGGGAASNQTRLGMDKFKQLTHHAYERGIYFYDMAEGYGSMPYVGEAIKTLPREKLTLLTKMGTQPNDAENLANVAQKIDEYRKILGTDYIDILLMHCLTKGGWSETRTHYMDAFSKAKQDGILKAVGVSCHNIDALREAAVSPWVDVIMARINPFGTLMDGTPDEIREILTTAMKNGKGVIGMKIFGEGRNVRDDEREQSIRYAINTVKVSCLTLGMESVEQIDDAIKRVMKDVS
ncbi:MAG: aldo/keto reductase [Tannerella sp.]|jgi:aryl-alcohol dehydrogenase-like predicted oxidoreductase|nr:aldo/keto reductase [Tannerella sp.]